jgi:threonine dehydratase
MEKDLDTNAAGHPAPSLPEIEDAAGTLAGRIVATPVAALASDRLRAHLPPDSQVAIKLELFQHAGSFKARAALLHVDRLDEKARRRGVTAVSAGNHALAVSWAAGRGGVSAKVVMPKTADPVRIAGCEALGGEVVLVDDVQAAFAAMERIVEAEGRYAIHPFEGRTTALGTATLGLELMRQLPDLEAVVVPVGGGGLIAGMSTAIKQIAPKCLVIGVEPEGADSMHRSFAAGSPQAIAKVATIADSLGAPFALPYSFGLARAHVDELVRIDDDAMTVAMALLYDGLKIAAEPAAAAATAALMGPLRSRLAGRRVGVIACGSNIGERAFAAYVGRGRALL